jgi:predicted ribosomally synthesized peptide with SipW-like signal peptide
VRISWNFSIGVKLAASFAVVGAASAVAGLGTFATFTSTTSASNSISSGTLGVAVGATGSSTNRLDITASAMAPGDSLQRSFDLMDTGTIDLSAITLTTTASPSSLLDTDPTNGLQMAIDACSVAWTESGAPPYTYTCGGSTSSALSAQAVIGSNLALSNLTALVAGHTDHLRLTLTLPAGADNSFQSLSSTVTYTFTEAQRAATNK